MTSDTTVQLLKLSIVQLRCMRDEAAAYQAEYTVRQLERMIERTHTELRAATETGHKQGSVNSSGIGFPPPL